MEIFSVPIETAHKCALFVSFAGAVLAALGTGVTLWTGDVLDKQSKEKIEDARSSADIARRDTEALRNQNLGLQREIEELRVKRMELERQFGPRHLTPRQAETFKTAIPIPLTGAIVAIQFHQSPEAFGYAKQIASMLNSRGISVNNINQGFAMLQIGGGHKEDIEITITEGFGFDVLERAFRAAGFKSVSRMIPRANELPNNQLMYDHRKYAAFIEIHEKKPVVLGL